MGDPISRKAFAENMRKISKNLQPSKVEGADDNFIRVTFELWGKLADMIESGVEVVRCKDCKHMYLRKGLRWCDAWGEINGMGDDGFCNYGERKENQMKISYDVPVPTGHGRHNWMGLLRDFEKSTHEVMCFEFDSAKEALSARTSLTTSITRNKIGYVVTMRDKSVYVCKGDGGDKGEE